MLTPTFMLALLAVPSLVMAGCKGSSDSAGGADAGDAGADTDAGTPVCPAAADSGAGPAIGAWDDFGPNARALAAATAFGQLNVYEVTAPHLLESVELYLRADLGGTRLTIAVYEAPVRNAVFRKLTDVQIDVPRCVGWIGSGALAIPLEAGRFYAVGFDPNQAVTPFVDAETNNLPVDGQFGRLIGSKTATSVSVDTLEWGKPSEKDFTRQRLLTSPRAGSAGDAGDAAGGQDGAGGG